MASPLVELLGISKYYRTERGVVSALSDITNTTARGEFVAVQGPSGCGKTTLLLAAGGLLAPDKGSVTIDGVNPYALSPDERARFRAGAIGFVFQQFHLVPYLTVRDNILAPSVALPRNNASRRADELIGLFNLSERAGHHPGELSTGERQRVALARALLNEPRLLLADEPTGNLDNDNAKVVLDTFSAFAEAGGTVLIVTHDTAIAGAAHRVIQLFEGRMV
ncbi:MAG: ABC transporter ATP-binding protein [Candidatus Latescibacter sp.]|nr:ABC transporter ATP-binding protein [Candidatus Latescibacter sp.]